MSVNPYKGGLTVGGAAFDKTKIQMRRPTPDSDVLASSDEDRDHVPPARPAANTGLYPGGRRPSSGWLQDIQPTRKFSLPSVSFALPSQPTTPLLEIPQQARPNTSSFPWNTASFTATPSATRFKEVVVPSPTSAHPPGDKALPSPTNEVDEGIAFLLNQQHSVRKSVRSQSYSVGQGDVDTPAALSRIRTSAVRHRPSKPSLLGESAVGLAQLREDDIDEVESSNGSEHGVRLPPGYWEREKQQALLKQAAMENARARNRATSTSSPISHAHRKAPQTPRAVSYGEYAIEEHDDADRTVQGPRLGLTRRFSEHVGRDPEADLMDTQQVQWATGLPPLSMEALSRRHSFAHYGGHHPNFHLSTLSHTQEEDEDETIHRSGSPVEEFDAAAYFTGYGPASRAINASAISAAHPDPIASHNIAANPYAVITIMGRPGRRLFVVAFKCSRADVYYLYDNTGLEIRRGDLVIVEGDRGADLGQVTHADVSLEDAKKYKTEANEEHFRWLVMFSQYSLAGTSNDSGMLGALARANGFPNNMNRAQLTGMGAQQDQDAKPKMIKRLAQQHEIMGLRDKEGQEAKAKRVGAQKAAEHKLPMEILDAEYQADYHKLTYFYYAEAYVNFNDLVCDLFKQYKVRIWMSAVNPASVVNPAGLMQVPPPSAIGPGAIIHGSSANASLSVGPGFGNNSYRTAEQYGRGRTNAGQASYDESYYPFAHQLPNYASQSYPMQQWGQPQPDMYGRYGYPNATASGSPMNYPAWYPPTSYSTSPGFNAMPSGASYRGGYPATTATSMAGSYGQHMTSGVGASTTYSTAAAYHPYTSSGSAAPYTTAPAYHPYTSSGSPAAYTTAPAYNPYATSGSDAAYITSGSNVAYTSAPSYGGQYNAGFRTSAGNGNGFTATSGPSTSAIYDAAFVTAMHNLNFGN